MGIYEKNCAKIPRISAKSRVYAAGFSVICPFLTEMSPFSQYFRAFSSLFFRICPPHFPLSLFVWYFRAFPILFSYMPHHFIMSWFVWCFTHNNQPNFSRISLLICCSSFPSTATVISAASRYLGRRLFSSSAIYGTFIFPSRSGRV